VDYISKIKNFLFKDTLLDGRIPLD